MTEPWPDDRSIASLDELMQALGCDDLDDLADYVEEHVVEVGEVWWNWYPSGDAVVGDLGNEYVGHVSLEVTMPTTLTMFHEVLEALSQRLEYRRAASELPTEDYSEEEWDEGSTARALAAFFDVDLHTFATALGEDWRPVEGSRLVGEKDQPLRWFGVGEPLRVLLGIGEDYATLAKPIQTTGVADDAEALECEHPTDVELRTATTLDRLAANFLRFLEMNERSGPDGPLRGEHGND